MDGIKDPKRLDHPAQVKKARRLLTAGIVLGVLLVVAGHLYILAAPIASVHPVVNWFVGINIIGAMLVIMSIVAYFTYMERLEPGDYAHEEEAPTMATRHGYSASRYRARDARRDPRLT